MTQKTNLASDGPDPRKIVGLVMASVTIYSIAKGKKVSPLAIASAVLTVAALFSR
jgi:hypothetical protein